MKHNSLSIDTIERWSIRFEGLVQGVGFRPLVSVCAHELDLTGFVYNDGAGVYVEVQGPASNLRAFVDAIQQRLPRLGCINNMTQHILPLGKEKEFTIQESPLDKEVHTWIPADTAPCADCLREMHEGIASRINYSFINCTHCGPRYTIIESMPYDRERTTMADFPMCENCQAEYNDLQGRRYHAEPNACHDCGPHYSLYEVIEGSEEIGSEDDWEAVSKPAQWKLIGDDDSVFLMARDYIEQGKIVALKGLGGYHLVCDAYNEDTIKRLRKRKHRPAKPLALMAGSMRALEEVVQVSAEEKALLEDPSRPIVLLEAKADIGLPLEAIAPGSHRLGLMLPYAPVHEVLLPKEALWVMTSGNRSGDPVLFDDQEALQELSKIADVFLVHNRRINAPVDDSVVLAGPHKPLLIRRSRGFVPEPIYSPSLRGASMLAMGSDLKNAFALNYEKQVLLGPHGGDLASAKSHQALEWTIEHYEKLFNIHPQAIVVDQHPSYFSSQLGRSMGQALGLPVWEVQHHHAHIGAVMAEHAIEDKVLGICFDGTGYGPDGTMWGGEFLLCQGGHYQRLAHLRDVPLLGGEMAVKEPWRQALYYLTQAYGRSWPERYEEWAQSLPKEWPILQNLMDSSMDFVTSSGAGRLFDAVGSLLGAGNVHLFDGQIAMGVEQLAYGEKGRLVDFHYQEGILDMMPTLHYIMEAFSQGHSRKRLAATFHRTLAFAMAEVAKDLCDRYGIQQVALAGGVFQNARLLEEFIKVWDRGPLLMNQLVPPNDGGLALGQLYVAHHLCYNE